jgi:hypothetical protein
MNKIKVGRVNKPTKGFVHIHCHRPFLLGNPYVMKNESDRDHVCDLFEDYWKSKEWFKNKHIRLQLLYIARLIKAGNDIELLC